jgi:hypothetical protein
MCPDYVRQPLLTPEVEDQLKTEMAPLWDSGLYGRQIVELLEFGEPLTKYSKVKPNYVYFYRRKFDLPIRQLPRFSRDTETYPDLPRHRYKHTPKNLCGNTMIFSLQTVLLNGLTLIR